MQLYSRSLLLSLSPSLPSNTPSRSLSSRNHPSFPRTLGLPVPAPGSMRDLSDPPLSTCLSPRCCPSCSPPLALAPPGLHRDRSPSRRSKSLCCHNDDFLSSLHNGRQGQSRASHRSMAGPRSDTRHASSQSPHIDST